MTWTQPVCEARFRQLYPDKEPRPLRNIEPEPCCFCRQPTTIYVRIDPATVPYPRES